MSIQAAHKVRINLDALTYAQKLWEALDTPVSLSCYLMLKHGEHKQLVGHSISASSYVDPHSLFLDYQAVKLLSKYPFLDTGIDTSAVALEKFEWAEAKCRETNSRFRVRSTGQPFGDRVERVLSNASRKIASILGRVPSLEQLDFSFGPGAAYGVRGETSVFNKVTGTLECSYAFIDKLQEFLEEFPGWVPPGIHDVSVIPGSQLTFVPKDAKTDRPICIEPLLNGLYQKGIGSYLRKRLRSHGIDLDDQGVNQRLASVAHRDRLATVDFTSASDTIAYWTVMDLLPIDWFETLDVARCPRYELNGVWRNFQKFTSMGNAYTFELETLIFYALAYACCVEVGEQPRTGVNLSVYGDDVIIPQSAFDLYSEVTEICGFALNKEKSFSDGLFFESCGQDFFDGTLVRPFLIKKRLNKLLPAFYAANTITRLQKRLPPTCKGHNGLRERLADVYAWVVGRIPGHLRVLGPEGFGDGHLIAEIDAAATSRPTRLTRHRHFDAWVFTTYVEQAVKVSLPDYPIAYALYNTRASKERDDPATYRSRERQVQVLEHVDNGSGYTVRGKTKLRKTRVFCHSVWHGPESLLSSSDDAHVLAVEG